MKELQQILVAYDEALKAGLKTALATVVHLEGSAYRRPGARMLVSEDGKLTGAISGGCLEGDALRKAQLVIFQQKAMLVKYDTTGDDESNLGVGLGCNGIISILIEPVNSDQFNPVELIRQAVSHAPSVLMTTFSDDRHNQFSGTSLLINKELIGSANDHQSMLETALEVLETGTNMTRVFNSDLSAFFQFVRSSPLVTIFGAGNDVQPLCEFADVLGWETIIVDGRANYATSQRFPLAKQVVVSKPSGIFPTISIDQNSILLLMTHNFNYDVAIMEKVLPMQPLYTGVLGPKKKLDMMVEELRSRSVPVDLSGVHGPAGLDIGAETPEEIALSIIAEIKAVLSGKNAAFLKNKPTGIHTPIGIHSPTGQIL